MKSLDAHDQRRDSETETFCIQGGGITSQNSQGSGINRDVAFTLGALDVHAVAHSLRADGFDASEDGTGRGTPLVFDPTQITHPENRSRDLSLAPGLAESVHQPVVAFSCKDSGADSDGETAPTLRAMGHDGSHANAGGQVAVAFNWQSGGDARGLDPQEVTSALSREQTPAMLSRQIVRRLTPRECARLQGFPDDYLDIPYRGKPAADGPKYKALGNSMAVPVVRWIGERIESLERALAERGIA